jgi:transketolase N-terminal domain/subunit
MTIYSLQKSAREARSRLIEEHGFTDYELGNALASVDLIATLLDRHLTTAEREAGHRLVALSTWQQRAAQAVISAQRSRAHRSGRWWCQATGLAEAVGIASVHPELPVWCLMTDADWQMGEAWSSLQLASAWHLDNLTFVTVMTGLHNGYAVAKTLPVEPLRTKLAAFGLAVYECDSGHYKTMIDGLHAATHDQRPTAVLVSAVYGAGLDLLEEAGEALLVDDRAKQLHELMARP